MTPSEHPQTPPLTKESPAEGAFIALPPLPPPPALDEAKIVRLSYWLDVALVVVVLLFAFLAASFPVYNPDFFRQLATGRLLLQGEYHFGVDPFVYTADGAYWANHSWLFALLMYKLYHLGTIGGAAVVIFKAIAIVALAGILMCAGWRRGQSLWIPAACTALAILAASPRFFLQPVVLSYLFLGLTIWLLFAGQGGKRIGWLLVPLFALWVNCDAWFFLGPLTVGLYLVGELLQQRLSASAAEPHGTRQNELWMLGGIFVLGVAVCLLNPHHIHALTLPPEFGLTAAGDVLDNDPQFRSLFYSPLRKEYYSPYFGLSVAGIAYWPLLLLSLASFALSIGRLSWPRLIVWIGFALLSFYNMRTIPFFALVAGPILSLNCLDYLARRFAAETLLTPAWRNGLLGGRIVALLLGLALLIATVPGWLQNQPQTRRLLGWSVQPDPSLEAMARTIHSWRDAGRLPSDPHWFNAYPEVADYMAWFAPGERVFLDGNLLYFRKAAEDYLAIRKGFQDMARTMVRGLGDADGDLPALTTDWRKILHEWNVHYWISGYFGTQRAGAIPDLIVILLSRPQQKEWVLCDLSGHLAIFAWRDPQQPAPDPAQGLALDFKRSAFGPKAELAPPRGEEPTPPQAWWEAYWDEWWQPTPRLSSDRDVVGLYEVYYQWAEQPKLVEESARAWRQGAAAGVVASSLPFGPVPNSLLALSWCCAYHDLYPAGALQPIRQPLPAEQLALYAQNLSISGQFMETPSLYLSVRAARRALAVNPDDSATYFRLGQIYQRLRELPQERFGSRLADLRRIQTTAAFQNCLRFPIDDEKAFVAHQALAQVFMQRRYVDVAVHHMREALNKRRAAGVTPGTSPEEFNKNLDNASAEVTRRESEVQRLNDRYELTAVAKTGLDRVNAALEMGLAETALKALEEASADSVSTSNDMAIIKRVTAVLLDLGQLDRARELLPDPEGQPVKPEEMDLYLNLAAGRGDYEKADRLVADVLRNAWQPPLGQPALPSAADRLGLLVGQALLGEARRLTGIPSMPLLMENASDFWIRRWRYLAIITVLDLAQQRADLHLLRGWLALEAGHSDEARKSFRAALDHIVSEKTWIPEVNKLNAWLAPEREIPQIQQLNVRHAVVQDLSKHYLSWVELANPKSEIRNPKEIQNPNPKTQNKKKEGF